jgi:hypothetical protein
MDHVLKSILSSDTNAHHIRSFNNLITEHIPNIISSYGKVSTLIKPSKYSMEITNVTSSPTRPLPSNCHTFGLNYLFCIRGTVSLYKDGVLLTSTIIPLAYIPLMTGRSVLSSDRDPSPEPFTGLFISKGKCRTIPPSKSIMFNLQILSEKNGVHSLQVRSAHSDKIYRSTSTFDLLVDDMGSIVGKLPFQPVPVALRTIVVALGGTPEDLFEYIVRTAGRNYDEALFCSLKVSLL